MPLQSGYKVVGTAGKTVDGRNIEKSWLEEAAETYDVNEYAAVINLNHWNPIYYGTYGKVLSVELGKNDKGETVLKANMEPSERLVSISKHETLYTSMELMPDFRGRGKHYLIGLAITPRPASAGTEQIKFSCEEKSKDGKVFTDYIKTELTFSEVSDVDVTVDKEAQTLLKKIFGSLIGSSSSDEVSEPGKEQMSDTNKAIEKLCLKLDEAITKFSMAGEKNKAAPDVVVDDAMIEALKAQGFSVEKVPSEQEVNAQVEALKKMGFTITSPEPKKPEGEDKGSANFVTAEQFAALQQSINTLAGKEVFTNIGDDNPGSDADSLEHL